MHKKDKAEKQKKLKLALKKWKEQRMLKLGEKSYGKSMKKGSSEMLWKHLKMLAKSQTYQKNSWMQENILQPEVAKCWKNARKH